MQGFGGLILFAAQLMGLLQKTPMLFFGGLFIIATFVGVDFIPGSQIGMEIMDYTIYKTGKDRSALTGALGKLLEKGQSAVSAALVGAILIAIGYRVDSVTGNYIGELSKMPTMLTWMIVIMGLIPAIMAFVGIMVLGKYPINPDLRVKIRDYIKLHQSKNA